MDKLKSIPQIVTDKLGSGVTVSEAEINAIVQKQLLDKLNEVIDRQDRIEKAIKYLSQTTRWAGDIDKINSILEES